MAPKVTLTINLKLRLMIVDNRQRHNVSITVMVVYTIINKLTNTTLNIPEHNSSRLNTMD
jgi:hypothetical protein